MTRFVPVAVLLMVLAAGGVAHAQAGSGSLPSGATIVFEHRKIVDPTNKANPFFEPDAGSAAFRHYFNLAHCNCAQANLGKSGTPGNFEYLVHETMPSGSTIPGGINIDFWVGTGCDGSDVQQRNLNCTQLTPSNSVTSSIANPDLQSPYGDYREFNLYQVVNGKLNDMMPCQQNNSVAASIFALARANPMTATGSYDYSNAFPAGTLSTDPSGTTGVDTQPPPQPLNLVAHSNESEIDVTWSAPSSGTTDIAYYQALCAMADGVTPVFPSRTSDPQYVTTQATCPPIDAPSYEVPTDIPLDNGEMQVPLATGTAFAALDARYICGEASTGTASSVQIQHLQNGVPYQVILVAVDFHGNFTAVHFDHTITPQAVTDFWEDLHDHGSKTEGGLCLLAETYGNDSALTRGLRAFRDDTLGGSRVGRWLVRAYYATLGRLGALVHDSIALRAVAGIALAPLVALALLWHWLGLPSVLGLLAAAWWLRRRRRAAALQAASGPSRWRVRRWLGVATTGALLVLGAGRAHAGNGGYQPYWEDTDPTRQSEQEQVPPGDPSLVSWHAGIRVGPYTPDIDNQLNMHPGPFERMFGTSQHLLTMLDVDRFLWTGFGQVGVGGSIGYWQKTASAFATMNNMTTTMRSEAPNTMRLIPLALTATYRFTVLDDDYGIPVVPYVRAGLGYYVWWVSVNGHYAHACGASSTSVFCTDGMAHDDKALGASLGVQGAIGLAIRAERIDASAAMSMQQSGMQHAGIYAELSLAKIDGFGSDQKLSVGDRTWFAGVDFEF